MNKKHIISSSLFLFISISSFAQLKVDQTGRIGMGTNYPNPEFKCHIAGNLLLSNYPTNPFHELRMKVGNGWPGTEIGANRDKIAIWAPYVDFNDVYAAKYLRASDTKLKSEVKVIEDGLGKIGKLRPVYYSIVDNQLDDQGNKVEGSRKEFGFIAQEVENNFPEVKITDDAKDTKLMDYDQIIPITVSAIQELITSVEVLKKAVADLQDQKPKARLSSSSNTDSNSSTIADNRLYQNSPNPFNEKTSINYFISGENFSSASILVFDMNGTLLKQYPITSSGKGELIIKSQELKAGMYLYSLVVNQQEVDTKKMILN